VSQLIFGMILVLAILFLPQGIAGVWRARVRRPEINDAPADASEPAPAKSRIARAGSVQ
jgi:hypothetical protein